MLGGVHVFYLSDFLKVDAIKQPIKINSVDSGNVSHDRAPAFHDHFDHSFVVIRCSHAGNENRNRKKKTLCPTCVLGLHCFGCCCGSHRVNGSDTSMTVTHKNQCGDPIHSHTASDETISASALHCERVACFGTTMKKA